MKKKEKLTKLSYFIIGYLTACILILCVTLIVQNSDKPVLIKTAENKNIPLGIEEIVSKCSNLSIRESAKCVQEYVKTFYLYNISNVNKELTFDELKEQGGVCSHFSELYCQIGKELNFSTLYEDRIKTGKQFLTINNETKLRDTSHAICIWSNEFSYIILDQKEIVIANFEK